MQAATAPASIRDQAFGVCRAHGFGLLGRVRTREAGAEACALLVALEQTFRIDLDPDELWPEARVTDLVLLVELKVSDKARRALLPANDDARGAPPPFRPRPRLFASPSPRDRRERARRARRQRRVRDTASALCNLVLTACFIGGLAGLVVGVLEIAGVKL